jgi:hypothetical protein
MLIIRTLMALNATLYLIIFFSQGDVPLGKNEYIHLMKKALSKWILVELSIGLVLMILFVLNII